MRSVDLTTGGRCAFLIISFVELLPDSGSKGETSRLGFLTGLEGGGLVGGVPAGGVGCMRSNESLGT